MTIVYAISNHKGGVAKTTTTHNLGAALALKKKKVLLIDLDSQMNLTQSLRLGKTKFETTIYESLVTKSALVPVPTYRKGLDIVPSSPRLGRAEIELAGEFMRESFLKNCLDPIKSNYDYVFIDCPSAIILLTINAFVAADKAIIPVAPDGHSIEGLKNIIHAMDTIRKLNTKLRLEGILLTRYSGRTVLHQGVTKNLEKDYPNLLFDTKIRSNVDLPEASTKHTDVFERNPSSAGAEDYKKLAEEIISKNSQKRMKGV